MTEVIPTADLCYPSTIMVYMVIIINIVNIVNKATHKPCSYKLLVVKYWLGCSVSNLAHFSTLLYGDWPWANHPFSLSLSLSVSYVTVILVFIGAESRYLNY